MAGVAAIDAGAAAERCHQGVELLDLRHAPLLHHGKEFPQHMGHGHGIVHGPVVVEFR